jgi:MFS family permease
MSRPSSDVVTLFSTLIIRLFAYGFLSVILALYLVERGISGTHIGLLFTFTLLGDAAVSLWITARADQFGRRAMLVLGAGLMAMAGVVFALTGNFVLLLFAAIIGVISPSGKEIGPFLSIEQAALSGLVPNTRRTQLFAWYNLFGSLSSAIGALAGGSVAQQLQEHGFSPLDSYRALVVAYAVCGGILAVLFLRLSKAAEIVPAPPARTPLLSIGLHRSKSIVLKMSGLFGLDAFAGGFILQSLIAYWFYRRFGVSVMVLGEIFFGANILAAVSALFAARIARRFGLLNTMVFTHIPSNVLLLLVPLMPTLPLAIAMLLIRFSISQMDVPTRQSYTMAIVAPDERSAASGVTTIARSIGASISPTLAGMFLASASLLNLPFFIAGGLKIVYDLLIFGIFRKVKPPEEY